MYYPEIASMNQDKKRGARNTQGNKKDEIEEIDPRIVIIGQELRKLRMEKGYTNYEHFAYDSGLSRNQYWRLEKGQNFKISSLLRILDNHGVTLKEFFERFDEI